MRHAARSLALAALTLLAATAAAAPVHLASPVDTLRADDALAWEMPVIIRNDGTRGLYVDSLWLDVRGADGATRRLGFQPLVRGMSAISVGDSNLIRLSAPASFERGVATLVLVAHDGDQTVLRARLERPIAPGVLARFTSRRSQTGGRAVEWVRVPAEPAAVPARGAPGIVLVTGPEGGSSGLLRQARTLAEQGFTTVCVSLPGQGGSEGPDDAMGPASVRAVTLALDSLAASPGVDRANLAIWGVGSGATAALLAAEARKDLKAVVAQSAAYDLWSVHRRAGATEAGRLLLRGAGADSAAWRARSPLRSALRAPARVLVLHGEADEVSPVADARDYVARRQAAGLPTDDLVMRGQGHALARGPVNRAVLAFLGEALGLTAP